MNVKSLSEMPVTVSENVKIMVAAPLCEPPVSTAVEVMVTVGAVASCVHPKLFEAAVLVLPAESAAPPTATTTVIASSAESGVTV